MTNKKLYYSVLYSDNVASTMDVYEIKIIEFWMSQREIIFDQWSKSIEVKFYFNFSLINILVILL